MDLQPKPSKRLNSSVCAALVAALAIAPLTAQAQIRGKLPDRGVYQPPRVMKPGRELIPVEVTDAKAMPIPADHPRADTSEKSKLRPVGHETVQLISPAAALLDPPVDPDSIESSESSQAVQADIPAVDQDATVWPDPVEPLHAITCDGCDACDAMGCDSIGCDSIGCDSMGGCGKPWWQRWSNCSLSTCSDRWFGGAELLLMFRKGDRPPPLITTSDNPDPDIAGQLDQNDTQIVLGFDSILKDMTAGGRFTIGTWIDNRQCRSLVTRIWFAGTEEFDFVANQDTLPTITRPFLNVTDGQAAEQDTLLVAFPDRADGSIRVNASNDVFGGDFQVRQFLHCRYGATLDFLYGYQYMRVNDRLGISSMTTSLDGDFAPIGSVIAVADSFEAQNEFHGGQVGLVSRYREGCWSFDGTIKTGFGSLRRRAKLAGVTATSVDGDNFVDPEGLLVRGTNGGNHTDHTFGWVPELDVSLGWHRYPKFDVTFGYHIIAMTEALQTSGMIDPNLAVNLEDEPAGQQRPALVARYRTFYVQGIHFGLQYVY